MSSASIAPAPSWNGSGVAPEALREDQFFDKLLQIRDEVFASKHPRIQLPRAVLEQVTPRPAAQPPGPPSLPNKPPINHAPNGSPAVSSFPPRPESSAQKYQVASNEHSASAPASRPFPVKPASSGIDPVLLTKSDQLIKAELQLKRQQIERAVKDQIHKKSSGNDTSAEEREAYLDIEDALAKAQALVKPLSGLRPPAQDSDDGTSFDENSYYSSKADSWSPERNDSTQTASSANLAVEPTAQAAQPQLTATSVIPHAEPVAKQAQPAVIDLEEEAYEPAEDIEVYEPSPAKIPEEQEESDYSPPPAAAGPSEPNLRRARDRRVEDNGGMNGSSRRQSPAGNPAPIQNPRKRRRKEDREERRLRQQANRRVVRSPEPYIKEEPQSPPPFASYPDSQPSKRRALQPLIHDPEVLSARGSRVQPVHYLEQDQSPRSYRPYEEPNSPTVIHVPQRRLERDDRDLRRVASLQSVRRPYSPGAPEPYHPIETRQIRAASHAYVDRPIEPVYREVSAHPSAAPRYIRDRSRSPIEEYIPRAQPPILMAPPARRIVEDQFGNRYYAAPVDVRESVAPVGRMEAEPYYERAVTHQPSMRAPVRTEIYEEENMLRMPPPPPRRYMDPAEPEVIDARSYRQREASHRPTEMEYAPRAVVERRPVVQYEEMGPPREYIPSRAYSVRPEVVRRELPEAYAPMRHESLAPQYVSAAAPRYRAVSVMRPEALDEGRYAFGAPPQGRRYVEEGVQERPVELAQEPYAGEARHVSYRY